MIKVIVERQLKNGEDIGRLLTELDMIAVLQKGHIAGETLINVFNDREITIVSIWERLEDWKIWEISEERERIIRKIDPLLARKAQIKIYEVMSPDDRELFEDPGSWMQVHAHPHFEG